MKKKFKIILIVVASIVLLGTIFGIVDYSRITNNKTPIFMIRVTSIREQKLNYIGLGYRMQRLVGASYTDPLITDTYIKFGLWFYVRDISVEGNYLYPEEKEETFDTYTYSYTPNKSGKSHTGTHTVSINGRVDIKQNPNLKSFGYKSLNEVENNLGVKLLKSDKLPQDYVSAYTYRDNQAGLTLNDEKNNPNGILIKASNYENDECRFTNEDRNSCFGNWPAKTLTLSISFLTQYASDENVKNNKWLFNDFSFTEPNVAIHHIDSLNVDAYIDGFPLKENGGTGMYTVMFVYDSILYVFEGHDFTNNEIIEIIESMRY